MFNYIAVILLLVFNFLLLINSLEVEISSSVRGANQNTYRVGDDIDLTCGIKHINHTEDGVFVGASFTQISGTPIVFFTVNATSKEVLLNVSLTGVKDITFDKNAEIKDGVTIKLHSADDKLTPSFTCVITTDTKKSQTPKQQLDLKNWNAKITGSEAISIHGADSKTEIKKVNKNEMVMIGCSGTKVNEAKDGTISQINLFQNGSKLVEFEVNDKGDWSAIPLSAGKGMLQKDEYTVDQNLNDTKTIHINNAKEEVRGMFKCEYHYNATIGGTHEFYTVVTNEAELGYNSGLRLNFSYSLILISLISTLISFSK